jgi:putative ABC transport system permease protein
VRGVWAAAFFLRRLRAERGIALLLVAMVGVTAFLVAAAPRLYNLVADAGLRQGAADASPSRRNLELRQEFVMPPEQEATTLVDSLGETYFQLMGDQVRSIVASRELVATAPRFGLRLVPKYSTYVSLRLQTGISDQISIAQGRLPQSTGERLPGAALEFGPPAGEEPEAPTRIEIAVSDVTAEESGLEVGQVYESAIDSADPLLPRALVRPLLARLEVVGIFHIADPAADIWYADNRLLRVGADFNADTPIVFVTALIAPDALADLVTSNLPFRYEWHYFIDPARLDAGRLDQLIPDLRHLETTFTTSTFASGDPERIVLRTGLAGIVDQYLAQRAASEAVLSVAAIGPFTLAAGAIGMLAVLLITRRKAALQLARGRGAATRLILGAQLWEGLLLAGSATVVGLALALAVVPGRSSELSVPLAVATGLAAVILLVGATWPAIRKPLDPSARDEPPPIRAAPRRLVLELTAVGLAVAGIGLLRQRGLAIGEDSAALTRFDPFLAAVPVLAGFAAGIVATRLYPFPIRALGWLAAGRRDIVPVLGLRNIGRRPSFATLPLLVLMLTAAFGAFALVINSSIDRGQLDASWREVGADYRIAAPPGADLAVVDAAAVPGVETVANAYVDDSAPIELSLGRIVRTHLAAIDANAYSTVVAGSAVEPDWPAELLQPFPTSHDPASAPGTPDNPIPAIISRTMPSGAAALSPGDVTHIRVAGKALAFRIVAVRPAMPGLIAGDAFVVAPLAALQADPAREITSNALFIRGSEAAEAALTDLVELDGPAATTIASRHAWYGALRGSPLIAVVSDGFRIGLFVALAYSAFAVITALTLTAARRTQDLAFLRTLGLSRAQAAGITVIEHATPVLVAVVPGIATGVVVAMLLESSLGLDSFIGSATSTYRTQLDWPGIAGMAAMLLGVVALSVAVSTWLARRMPVVEALRMGEA